MGLSQIIGHDKMVARLKSMLVSERVPPALLFTGPEGVGKFLAAKEFARALTCLHKPLEEPVAEESLFNSLSEPVTHNSSLITHNSDDACGVCASCLQIDSGAHPDVRIIDTIFQAALLDEEESRNLKVDTIREVCRYANQTPILSARKVFIIRDAEAMVPQAQNALLKTLEEPPPDTVLILTVSKKNALFSTIISRCYILDFTALPRPALERLLEAQGLSLNEAAALSSLSQGSLKKAQDLLKLSDRLKGAPPLDGMGAFKMSASLPKDTHRARHEVGTLLDLLLAGARVRWAAAPEGLKKPLSALVTKLLALRRMITQNVSYALILETALLESEKLGILPENIIKQET
ncbi:MAG: DNA polymerase III subunit delta' [Elusimicrobia bacterium]|nr:DNA polymerase III subunit delta' [Elusimicrobiota bacterium]